MVIFPVRNSDFCQIELCLLHKPLLLLGLVMGLVRHCAIF
ncbi:hypothetical protein SALWKB12_2152 [Snodgrassella communis]|uniref:Uncharacterized protein n=1 Tax=Snodgrassella communis TaxID=2946699 RepID=A0A837B1W4_9NEIS|nr:hypothetical protein SALWKB12_2152 [Snodgrassella communis]KDN13927.1 hypothetical protein SALWKB29_2068 [Snodgrassella communis]